MNKYKILISWPLVNVEIKKLNKNIKKNFFFDYKYPKQFLSENEIIKIIHKYDGIICGDDQISKKVLLKAKKLKVISKWGTGLDSIDVSFANKLGIRVYNSPGAFTESVSQLALGMIIALNRQMLITNDEIKKGNWPKLSGFNLNSLNFGILGLGKIGLETARLLSIFRGKIYGYDIRKIDCIKLSNSNIFQVSKNFLLKNSNVIICCTDLNKSSFRLIDFKDFLLMEKKPIIINISRGKVINELALINALKTNKISGAGLDVFENEPIKKRNKLFQFKNCIFSSHNAFNTYDSIKKVNDNSIKNLLKVFNV